MKSKFTVGFVVLVFLGMVGCAHQHNHRIYQPHDPPILSHDNGG